MREWLRETHGVKFELVRHFLARMFDSDLFSAAGQWQSVAVGAFATIFPAFLMFGNYGAKYRHLDRLPSPIPFRSAAIADELSFLVLVMSLGAVVALMQWQSLFPSKRDYFALAALPIRSRQIFISRFIAVFVFITGLIVTATLMPSIAIPIHMVGHWAKSQSLLVNIGAYAATSCIACYFVFIAIMAVQGLLLHLLPRRMFARVSVYVQGLGIAVFFLAALFSWTIGEWQPSTVAQLPRYGAWAPPVWFVGLHEWLLGDRTPFFTLMQSRALIGFAAVCATTLVTYVLGYTRYRKLLVDVPDIVEAPRHLRWSLLRPLASDPRTEAAMQFMAKTLARSRVHRVVLLGYIGLGVGFAANALALTRDPRHLSRDWYEVLQFAVLFWPIALTAVLLPGFRHACSMPAELRANWIFRSTESMGRAQWMSGVERFILVCIIGPIYLLFAPIAISVLGWSLAMRMLPLQVLVSLTMFEVLFTGWQKLPFTCSYLPGKRPMMEILARALAAFGVLVPLLVVAVRAGSFMWEAFVFYGAIFAGIWWWARRRRLDGWGEVRLIYHDVNETVANLGISELSYRPSETLVTDDDVATSQTVSSFGAGGGPGNSSGFQPPIDKTLRLYRAIAGVFPREFRDCYGDELLQVTDDAIESIWHRRGRLGLAWLLVDITGQAITENVAQLGRDMRCACRTMFASPGFTATAVILLMLAISLATYSLSM